MGLAASAPVRQCASAPVRLCARLCALTYIKDLIKKRSIGRTKETDGKQSIERIIANAPPH